MIEWLKKHKQHLSIRAIEKEIGCPTDTLQKYVKGRPLPQKWVTTLEKFIKSVKCNSENNCCTNCMRRF